MKGLEFSIEGCNDIIGTDITEMDMQQLQPPCFVPLGTDVTEMDMQQSVPPCFVPLAANEIKESGNPNKKARFEKVVKKMLLIYLSEPRMIKNSVVFRYTNVRSLRNRTK
jgi:hypothetical protein